MKSKIFKYRHIKLEIRFPSEQKDIQDKYDYDAAFTSLCKEWQQMKDEVDRSFGIINIVPKDNKLRLP